MTTAITARSPIGPTAARNVVVTGSVSLPDSTSLKSGTANTSARQTSMAANPPI